MTALRTEDLALLLEAREGPCVSLYMPTHRKGRDVQQDPIRFKNLLRQAEKELEGIAIRGSDGESLLAPARALTQDPAFWAQSSDGLAIFLAPGFHRTYRVPSRFRERLVVSGAFNCKQLLPLLSGDGQFYVLALSRNHVRLLQGTRFRVSELEPTSMPRSLKEALWVDDPEKTLQYHTGSAGPGGRRAAVYHGQGGAADLDKANLERFFRRVDDGLIEFLGAARTPLVLAGVENYFPIYRAVSHYPMLQAGGIKGNPDDLSTGELHARAWARLEPVFRREQDHARTRYTQLTARGTTSDDVRRVVPAAHHGRVESLFVALGEQSWGAYIPSGDGSVVLHAAYEHGDQDLLDVAAVETLRHGGRVYAVDPVEVPAAAPLAAIFRY